MFFARTRKARTAIAAVGAAALAASVFGIAAPASASAGLPVVTKLNVSKGSSAGGTVVTITGKNFTGATAVDFDAAVTPVAGTGLLVLSDTQIAVVAPIGTSSAGQVRVTTPAGASADTAADNFSYIVPMDATAAASVLNPLGKSTFIVTSSISVGADAAAFKALKVTATVDGVTAPVAWASSTTVTVTAPVGTPSASASSVVLYHDGVPGAADTTHAVYAPVISALSKSSGPLAGGATITVTGKGLTGATAWLFGGVSATCTAVSVAKVDTSWTCLVPAGSAGPVSVKFTPAAGTYGTLAGATYTYSDVS